jgi:hypothetical protein
MNELPGTNDFSFGPTAHTNIAALGGLVRNKAGNSGKGKDDDSQNGVGGGVTEPGLGKRRLVLLGHSGLDGSRATHHASLESGGTVIGR